MKVLRKHYGFLTTLVPVLLADRLSKLLAVAHLAPGVPRDVLGGTLRFTLLFNRAAAMDITLGPWSRWGFATMAVVGVVIMLRLLHQSAASDWIRGAALGLISAGATGNLIDRLRWDRGVVDFIDVGVGTHRFWTFNVADSAVMVGAVLLTLLLSHDRHVPSAAPSPGASAAPG
jgi:signal peptidase II